MSRTVSKLLDVGPLELEVLGVLNAHPDQSVHDIQAHLKRSGHELAYTTVMTVLVRLHQKGLVDRRKESRYFLYSQATQKETSTVTIFGKVTKSLFRNEKLQPILGLLDANENLSKEDLQELRKVVEERLKRL